MYIGTTYEYLHCIHVNDERLGKRALHSHHVVRPQRGVGSGQRLACRGARRARRRRTPVARTRRAQTHVAQRDVPCVDLALELVDFLKCISALEWSMNSLSCKFLYQPLLAGPGWDVGFYRAIGLETLFALELVHSIRETARDGRDCRGRPRVGCGSRDGGGHVAVQRRRRVARQ